MERRADINFMTMLVGNFALMAGFALWRNLFNNFAVEEIGITATQVGVIQAVREVPGLIGFLLALVVMLISEVRLTFVSIIVLGFGVALTGFAYDFWMLAFSCFLMSLGFHFFFPLQTAITMKLLDSEHASKLLARYRSDAQLAGAVVTGAVTISFWLIDWLHLDIGMRHFFIACGIIVMLVGVYLTISIEPTLVTISEKKVRYKKRYWLYYVLQFLSGARRHIFTTFAIFLLVQVHQVSVKDITLLIFINSILAYLIYRRAGDIINAFGERSVLLVLYAALIFLFLGYAYIDNLWLLFFFFAVNHILFGFNLALEIYFKKTALPADITSNISAGMTINHVSAIFIPIVGGIIWDLVGFQTTFIYGAVITALSFLFCLYLRPIADEPAAARAPEA